MIVLPLASAGVVLHVVAQDYGRRRVRYSELISTLEVAARRIQRTRTWHSLTQIALETEEELLREVFEWYAVTRFAGQAQRILAVPERLTPRRSSMKQAVARTIGAGNR